MELKQIWEEALKIIENETPAVSFETWIEPIIPCGIDGTMNARALAFGQQFGAKCWTQQTFSTRNRESATRSFIIRDVFSDLRKNLIRCHELAADGNGTMRAKSCTFSTVCTEVV